MLSASTDCMRLLLFRQKSQCYLHVQALAFVASMTALIYMNIRVLFEGSQELQEFFVSAVTHGNVIAEQECALSCSAGLSTCLSMGCGR